MKVLVTGANGLLGRRCVEEFHKNGVEVIATDFATNNIIVDVIKIDCNIFDIEDPYEYFGKPDAVLHMAWKDVHTMNSDAHFEHLGNHATFLRKLVESGLKQLSIMGTMSEIGLYEGSLKEDTPANPMNNYGIAKVALRSYAKILCENNNVVFQWLRAYITVFDFGNNDSLFGKLRMAEAQGQKEFPLNSGKNLFDFLDAGKSAEQVVAAVMQQEINGVIEICFGEPMRLSERVEQFIKDNNFKIRLNYGAFPERPFDSKAIWGDNTKIQKILENRK